MPVTVQVLMWKYGITKILTIQETIELLQYEVNYGSVPALR